MPPSEATLQSQGSSRRRIASRIVVDSWAWVEFFKASEEGEQAKQRIEQADDVLTPGIVLAELARKYLREGEDLVAIRKWLNAIVETTQVVEIDALLAEESAKVSAELTRKAKDEHLKKPGLGDAIILATARVWSAQLLTGDSHFRGLRETLWIPGSPGS
jgi:predicted nucleic acid-binding protein